MTFILRDEKTEVSLVYFGSSSDQILAPCFIKSFNTPEVRNLDGRKN